jgi:hypothetical protein
MHFGRTRDLVASARSAHIVTQHYDAPVVANAVSGEIRSKKHGWKVKQEEENREHFSVKTWRQDLLWK